MKSTITNNSISYVAKVVTMKKNKVILCLDDNNGTVAVAKAIPGVMNESYVFCRLTGQRHTTRSQAKITGCYDNKRRDLAS